MFILRYKNNERKSLQKILNSPTIGIKISNRGLEFKKILDTLAIDY